MKKVIYILTIIILLAIIGVGGYFYYDLNNKVEKLEKESKTIETKEENKEKEEDKTETLTLLNEEITLKSICPNAGMCNKTIGDFELGGEKHTLKISYNTSTDEIETNKLIVDNTDIKINSGSTLDKIVKVGNDYLAITTTGQGAVNSIYIYDKNLKQIKDYLSFPDANNTYFSVNKDTFTYLNCNSKNATAANNYEDQKMETIEVNTKDFSEKIISSVNNFCNAQT